MDMTIVRIRPGKLLSKKERNEWYRLLLAGSLPIRHQDRPPIEISIYKLPIIMDLVYRQRRERWKRQ